MWTFLGIYKVELSQASTYTYVGAGVVISLTVINPAPAAHTPERVGPPGNFILLPHFYFLC